MFCLFIIGMINGLIDQLAVCLADRAVRVERAERVYQYGKVPRGDARILEPLFGCLDRVGLPYSVRLPTKEEERRYGVPVAVADIVNGALGAVMGHPMFVRAIGEDGPVEWISKPTRDGLPVGLDLNPTLCEKGTIALVDFVAATLNCTDFRACAGMENIFDPGYTFTMFDPKQGKQSPLVEVDLFVECYR